MSVDEQTIETVLTQVLPYVNWTRRDDTDQRLTYAYVESEFHGREWVVMFCPSGDHTITLEHGLLEFSCLCDRDWGSSARMLEHAISGALHTLSITEKLALIEAHVMGSPA